MLAGRNVTSDLLLYVGDMSLEFPQRYTLFKHLVDLCWCSSKVMRNRTRDQQSTHLAVSGTINQATATTMAPVHPKKNPVRTPQFGAPLSMMGVTNEN